MTQLIEAIRTGNASLAKEIFHEMLHGVIEEQLEELKQIIALTEFKTINTINKIPNPTKSLAKLHTSEVYKKDKTKGVTGFKRINGKLVRMTSLEKYHRQFGVKKAKLDRDIHRRQTVKKMVRTKKKAKALGL